VPAQRQTCLRRSAARPGGILERSTCAVRTVRGTRCPCRRATRGGPDHRFLKPSEKLDTLLLERGVISWNFAVFGPTRCLRGSVSSLSGR